MAIVDKTDEIIETLIKEQTEALLRNRQELAQRRENEKERLRVLRHEERQAKQALAPPKRKDKPPSQREKRWTGVIVREVVHAKLRELSKFYNKPVTRIIEDWTEEAFTKALIEIEANTEKTKQ
jgi:hypothetical protein